MYYFTHIWKISFTLRREDKRDFFQTFCIKTGFYSEESSKEFAKKFISRRYEDFLGDGWVFADDLKLEYIDRVLNEGFEKTDGDKK